jgi:5'-nucleotidase
MKNMKTVFPFGNTIAVLSATGAELLELLEASSFCAPQPAGGFLQVAGITCTIDTSVPYAQGEQYPSSTFYAPAKPGSRVTIETVGGKPFDPAALYVVATNDYLAAGGDQAYVLRYANQQTGYNTFIPLEDALIAYTKTVLGGVIGDNYATPAGRIALLP